MLKPPVMFEVDFLAELNRYKECGDKKKLCNQCVWFENNGGYCSGCDDNYQQRCYKRICAFTRCDKCGGGGNASCPGCCGRAPKSWKKKWDNLLNLKVPDYPSDPLEIKCKIIPMIHSIKKYNIPELFPEIDAWFVPLHRVINHQGKFRADDLKAYLGLPKDRILILSTYSSDDFQEMLWKKWGTLNYKDHGIDYWFPGHFSIYDNDSKILQFANSKRQQLHAVFSKSQFVWFRLGEHIPIRFLSPIRNAASVLISTGQMFNNQNRLILNREVEAADAWFPEKTAFFVTGNPRNLPIGKNRTCYQFESSWLIRGLMGYNMNRKKNMNDSIEQVLVKNLKEVAKKC